MGRKTQPETHRLPPLPHERMARRIPAIAEELPRWLELATSRGLQDRVLLDEDFEKHLEEVPKLALEWAHGVYRAGIYELESAIWQGDLLISHLQYVFNHALHHRRTFWVDESLAWMLADTELDVIGDALRLPFPVSCFAFTDARTLDLCHRVFAAFDPEDAHRPKSVAAYALRGPERDGHRLVRIYFLLDDHEPERWPVLLSRDLWYGAEDDLATVLRSRRDDLGGKPDPFWTLPEVVDLVHLVINCVLYTTCSHFTQILKRSPLRAATSGARPSGRAGRRLRRQQGRLAPRFSSDDVFHLPGPIPIDRLRKHEACEPEPNGGRLTKRFMVRGHWRRANPSWTDQRLRWVEPYWKGPDMAAAIERQYRLKGPAATSAG
ncbi:MAG: hypothetical protein M5U28_13975 [Sandaracinaceae bacterium]|nr:hypothetical protein [Sandaracinaceae bacterium]